MRKAKWLIALAAITAVIGVMAACNNSDSPCAQHDWGDWARVIADPLVMQTIRTCTVSGCNEQQIFTGGIYVQTSTIQGLPAGALEKEMVRIPAGSIMGTMRITQNQDFWMSRHQVTQAQWQQVMAGNLNGISAAPSYFRADGGGAEQVAGLSTTANLPVESVSWFDALVFANRLSQFRNLTPVYSIPAAADGVMTNDPDLWGDVPITDSGADLFRWMRVQVNEAADGYRLPTSVQWEYAALAGTTTDFNNGVNWVIAATTEPLVDGIGWFSFNSDTGSGRRTHPVGTKIPNAWGLYDMHGNVWEWCWDASFGNRVIRGGSWLIGALSARSSILVNVNPWGRWNFNGFRLVRPAN